MKIKNFLTIGVIVVLLILAFYISHLFTTPKENISSTHNIESSTSTYKEKEDTIEEKEISDSSIESEPKEDYVYTTINVNIRTQPSTYSDILLTAETHTKLLRTGIDIKQGWDEILINGKEYYIYNEYITIEEPKKVAKPIEDQLEESTLYPKEEVEEKEPEPESDNNVTEVISNVIIDDNTEFRYMASIIYAEAGNQCVAGQQAVGIVVMERVRSVEFANTVYDVIHEPGQFSPVRDGNLANALSLYDSGRLPQEALDAATYALSGNTTVYYNGNTYDLTGFLYFSRYVDGCRLQIQDHQFK